MSTKKRFEGIVIQRGPFTSRLTGEEYSVFYIIHPDGSILRCIGTDIKYDLKDLQLLRRDRDKDLERVSYIIKTLEEAVEIIKRNYRINKS